MKKKIHCGCSMFVCLIAAILQVQLPTAEAQGTAFTYQGRLNDNSGAASGSYNFTFALFNTNTGGVPLVGPVTSFSNVVSNGLFTAIIDFGSDAFSSGGGNWLEIAVQTNGGSGFTTLAPRQQLTPAPYAIYAPNAGNSLMAASAGSVAAANIIGSIPLAQLPSGLVTNGADALNIAGTVSAAAFSGAGTFSWAVVAGTAQLAQPNTGYLLTNGAQVTVTLPTSPNLGDIVSVSGTGANGWKIAQNGGQSVLTTNLIGNFGAYWIARDSSRFWVGVASSADGTKLVATVSGGRIYTSTDSGTTWTPRDSVRNWSSTASSADGQKLVAGTSDAQIYTSTDSGNSWIAHDTNRSWVGVASSADGVKLVAAVGPGRLYTSTDSGFTWTARDTNRNWYAVASSADGVKLVAVAGADQIYTSTNSGITWTPRETSRNWTGIASSADGSKLVATVATGLIYTSTDSGVTWIPRASSRYWNCVASSADGNKLVAGPAGGQIYTSTDSGVTWNPRDSTRNWYGVASSADGGKLVSTINGGQIYTSIPGSVSNSTTGIAGSLIGDPNTAIQLLYTGNGQFLPLSHEGVISTF